VTPELDLSAALANFAGDEAMYREVLEMSLPDLISQIESSRLRLEPDCEDARQALYKELHALKGAAQNLGLMRIGATIADIERAVGDPAVASAAINPPLTLLAARLNKALDEMRDYLGITA
jgi:chemotaxis protein histidine kinase CheA